MTISKNKISFNDSKGIKKFLQLVNGEIVHTGNSNYIKVGGEVMFYPLNKTIKMILHKIR